MIVISQEADKHGHRGRRRVSILTVGKGLTKELLRHRGSVFTESHDVTGRRNRKTSRGHVPNINQ